MRKFIIMVLCVSGFFTGLGNMLEKASANLKSDDKALEIVRRARIAIGGDAAINSVKSMTITAKTTKTFDIEGASRTETGDSEINFELPNKMSRQLKLGTGNGDALIDKQVNVIVMKQGDGDNFQWKTEDGKTDGVKKIIIKKDDGTTEELKNDESQNKIFVRKNDGNTANVEDKKVFIRKTDELPGGVKFRSNDLLRTTLSLLLSTPEGTDISFAYVGEGNVDDISCDIIAANDGGSSMNLYLDKSTSLPRMMTYQGHKPFIIKMDKVDGLPDANGKTVTFQRKMESPEMTEYQVKFSDFRSVNGLQLPFKWTQTVGGKADETTDVTNYEINPANIADKFKEVPAKVFIRTKKEQ